MKKIFLIPIVVLFILPILLLAQSDGSIPDSTPSTSPEQGSLPQAAETLPRATAVPSPSVRPEFTPDSLKGTATQGISAPGSVVTPTSYPVLSSEPSPAILSVPTAIIAGGGYNSLSVVVSVIASILALVGLVVYIAKTKSKKNNDENRCESIRDLLQQKKKELEDFIRNYPEDKIKEMADKIKDEAIEELKKDEDAKKILDTAEDLKKKHDRLKETIELLQKRYDLCILSLPTAGETVYKGTIVENSLKDKSILKNLKITRNYNMEDWVLNDVLVNEKQIEKIGEFLDEGPWYMNFWQEKGDDMIIVFRDKIFKIKYSNKETWEDALRHGRAKGIPESQLDFKPN